MLVETTKLMVSEFSLNFHDSIYQLDEYLVVYIYKGNLDLVRYLVTQGVRVRAKFLALACLLCQDVRFIRFLLSSGGYKSTDGFPKYSQDDFFSPTQAACIRGNISVVNLLV